MNNTALEKILIEIECPVCNIYMLNEIAQCFQGHSFCKSCSKKMEKCPFCESLIIPGRNLKLESFIKSCEFSCMNQNKGCNFQGSAMLMIEHQENECEHKEFRCPTKYGTNCTWVGIIADMKSHMSSKHNGIHIFHFGQLNIEFLELHDRLFKVLHRRLETGNLEWCVQYVGSKRNAAKYMFHLEFIDQSKSGFEAFFTGLCMPYGKDKDAFNLERISIHEDTLKRFKNKTGSYNYRIKITKQ